MSMEVNGSYEVYNRNSAYSYEIKQTEITKQEKAKSSKDNVQEYYERLCKKFPRINFNTSGGVLQSSSSKVTVNLSQECLKKMANDPKFAKEIEWNLSGEVAANSLLYSWAKRDGVELGGPTVKYDANGNRESSCGGMRTANAGNGNNINKLRKKYKEEEERWIKARKKREKKEKLEKKRAEKKLQEISSKTEFRGKDLEDLTEQFAMKLSGQMTLISGGSFDVRG